MNKQRIQEEGSALLSDKNYCFYRREQGLHLRRCFMTGEYCSKLANIQSGRENCIEDDEITITAFMVLNFTNINDVIYDWKIKPFIESIRKFFLYDKDEKRLICYTSVEEKEKAKKENHGYIEVREIKPIRADSDPSSNYVVCSRICQQMQMADLVIVDVTDENPNVFYEFGLAVALEKLILPICYSESFFEIGKVFDSVHEKEYRNEYGNIVNLGRHIDCFPWRRKLYEYFGLMYRTKDSLVHYLDFEEVKKPEHGFSDKDYDRFPYNPKDEKDRNVTNGKRLYDALKKGYNRGIRKNRFYNTIIIYTVDRILNADEAGSCIVHFYHAITRKVHHDDSRCFVGNRVGILANLNQIKEEHKDKNKSDENLYPAGEVLRIGVNEATFKATCEEIKADALVTKEAFYLGTEDKSRYLIEDMQKYIKDYAANRAIMIYPEKPLHIDRLRYIQQDIARELRNRENNEKDYELFCFFHIILRTLQYVNELVVDITGNSFQNLFWLGVAHGMGVHSVTVLHDNATEEAVNKMSATSGRQIFDVSGLWTAKFSKKDIKGFYSTLASVQRSLECNSKMIVENDDYLSDIKKDMYEYGVVRNNLKWTYDGMKRDRDFAQKKLMESYYRRHFWNALLRYNRLNIYIEEKFDKRDNGEPVARISLWDTKAVSALSYYISKRTVIGEYEITTARRSGDTKSRSNEETPADKKTNCILVGSNMCFGNNEVLPEYIWRQLKEGQGIRDNDSGINCIHKRAAEKDFGKGKEGKRRGGYILTGESKYDPNRKRENEYDFDYPDFEYTGRDGKGIYNGLGQLILWREGDIDKPESEIKEATTMFRASFAGSSGPSTYALSSLFIDEKQKRKIYDYSKGNKEKELELTYLSELQMEIREKLLNIYIRRIRNDFMKECKRDFSENEWARAYRLCEKISYASYHFLTTMLYQFFFPFHSRKDVDKIKNSLSYFLCSWYDNTHSYDIFRAEIEPLQKAANWKKEDADAFVMKLIDIAVTDIKNILTNLSGIEAFYAVEVSSELTWESDERKPEKTSLKRKQDGTAMVNFIFKKWEKDDHGDEKDLKEYIKMLTASEKRTK